MTLKRSPMPTRTVPLRRTEFRRVPPAVVETEDGFTVTRSGRFVVRATEVSTVRARPTRKRNDDPAFRVARGLAFRRSGGLCVVCGCSAVHGHHRIRRSQGGPNVEANILPVCALCHGKIHGEWSVRTSEDRREHRQALAFRAGWLVKAEDRSRPLLPWWELASWRLRPREVES